MEVSPSAGSARILSPWLQRPAASPRNAAATPQDSVQIQPPPAVLPQAQAPQAAPALSPRSRWIIIGCVGLAVAGAVGGGIAWVNHTGSTTTAPAPVPVHEKSTTTDGDVLRALDKAGQLTLDGQPTDAFAALRALSSGQPVGVGIPRLGYHERATIDDPSGALTQDAAKDAQDKLTLPNVTPVRSFTELRRLNAAEKLTDIDTHGALTAEEQSLITKLQPFEGGVPTTHIEKNPFTSGVEYRYGSDLPQPGLLVPNHSKSFKAHDRLTALQALERLEQGQPVVVRSASGLEQTIRQTAQLPSLDRLEAQHGKDSTEVRTELSDAESIVRELASGKQLQAGDNAPDIAKGQVLTGFQASQLLDAGKPVVVNVGNGLSGTVTSMKDLALFNAEEGLTKIDGSGLLSARDLKTSVELRTYEGRSGDPKGPALFGTRPAHVGNGEVASSQRLDVRDARAQLGAGKTIAIRTHRGQIHLIHNVDELDTLSRLVPAPPAPPPAAPGTPAAGQPGDSGTPTAPTDSTGTGGTVKAPPADSTGTGGTVQAPPADGTGTGGIVQAPPADGTSSVTPQAAPAGAATNPTP